MESYERLKTNQSAPAGPLGLARQQLVTARDNLEFVGMGRAQIEELGRTRREIFDIDLTAPAGGQILERHVTVGQRFMKGELLYRIANLEHVWVLADLQRGEEALLGAIAKARIRVPGLPPLEARVAAAAPQFDEQGRTGKLRLEVDNPRGILVPGMIVNVDLDAPAPSALTIHAGAVIDSGTSKRVFVALGGGQYELREVETGWQEGDRVEIRGGLKAGERVVTAGAFLLDSESRMKSPRATTMIDRLIELSARHRGTVIGLVLAMAAWGAWSIRQIPTDAFPDLSDTQLILYSRWDRSPDLIEDQVTYPIVTAMLGAPKVKAVRGVSDFGYSFVYVVFEDGTDLYWARSRTLEYLAGVLSALPAGVKTELGTGCHRDWDGSFNMP